MMKNYLLVIVLIASCQLFSQEVYLKVGTNLTKYDYKNALLESNPNIQKGTGNFYEVGFANPLIGKHLDYSFGVALNEYNAMGGNSANSYSWDTKYLGLNGGLSYSIFSDDSNFNFLLHTKISGMSIIYGKQEVDGFYYDLMNNEEFSGFVVGTSLGFELKHTLSNFGFLSLGYDYNQTYNISNTSDEDLSFLTHQIQLGMHFIIKSKSKPVIEPIIEPLTETKSK
jgi:hypothetical protein